MCSDKLFCAAWSALLLLLAMPASMVSAREPSSSPVAEALEQVATALQDETTLSPETKKALLDLVSALQTERAQTAQGSTGVSTAALEAPASSPDPDRDQIESVVDEYLAKRETTPEASTWQNVLDRLKVYGDLRFRGETTINPDDKRDNHRARIRGRLGANYQLYDDLVIGARVVTSSGDDPKSTHVTLGDGFKRFDIDLDRAFLTYQPDWASGGWVTAGKFAHPFRQNPVYGELVWDADVQPEGAVLGYTNRGIPGLDELRFVGGGYYFFHQNDGEDAGAVVAQASARIPLGEHFTSDAAIGYYWWPDPTPDDSSPFPESDLSGKFGILNPILSVSYNDWSVPVVASAELIYNTLGTNNRNTGYALGLALGRKAAARDWRVYYQWQDVETNSVFSAVSQDDFSFTTDFRGHVFGVNYQLFDKIGLHAWTLVARRDDSSAGDTRYVWRPRLDLNIKF